VSRAFVRDPEPGEPRCPACGAIGEPVGALTLDALVPPERRAVLGNAAYCCASPGCAVGWFTAWGESVPAGRSYPKDPAAPICPCTGLTATDVIADAKAGRKERVKALLARSEGPESRCAATCPDGKPCVARVFRLFRESFGPTSGA
jgi:hypothetical protein